MLDNIKKIFEKKKQKDEQPEKLKGVADTKVNVIVWKQLGGSIPVKTFKFKCTQERDSNDNLILKSEEMNFKENLNIEKHETLERIGNRLKFSTLDREGKLKIIKEKIKLQDALLSDIENGKVEKQVLDEKGEIKKDEEGKPVLKYINKLDEERVLKNYKILKYTVENEGDAIYEFLDDDGSREVNYMLMGGMFFPMPFNPTTLSFYVGIDTKKKIYKQKSVDYLDEYKNDMFGGAPSWFSNVPRIIWIVSFLMMVITIVYNLNMAHEQSGDIGSIASQQFNEYVENIDLDVMCNSWNKQNEIREIQKEIDEENALSNIITQE